MGIRPRDLRKMISQRRAREEIRERMRGGVSQAQAIQAVRDQLAENARKKP